MRRKGGSSLEDKFTHPKDLVRPTQALAKRFQHHYASDYAEIAQLVEHFPEEEGVAGSSPALGTVNKNRTLRRGAVFCFSYFAPAT